MTAKQRAHELLPNQTKYINRWFDHKTQQFFSTQSISDIYRDRYFITHDRFMNQDMWALRRINVGTQEIETIKPAPLNSKEECIKLLKSIT